MSLSIERSEQRKSAQIAGLFLIFMAMAAFFSYGYVHGSLVVLDDAQTTYDNITSSLPLFKAEIFGWVIILISDIIVAWAFFTYLKPINESLSLLGAWLRLVYAALLGIAVSNLIYVWQLSVQPTDEPQAQMILFLEAFESMWSIGLIIFGLHLCIVGYLAFQSSLIPKVISFLLLIAGGSYMMIHLGRTFLPQYDGIISVLEAVLSVPMAVGELGFGIWLLVRGGKTLRKA